MSSQSNEKASDVCNEQGYCSVMTLVLNKSGQSKSKRGFYTAMLFRRDTGTYRHRIVYELNGGDYAPAFHCPFCGKDPNACLYKLDDSELEQP